MISSTANELRGPARSPGRRTQSKEQKIDRAHAEALDQLGADLDAGRVDTKSALKSYRQIIGGNANAQNEVTNQKVKNLETAAAVARVTRDGAAMTAGALVAAPAAAAVGLTGTAAVVGQAAIAGTGAVVTSGALDTVSIASAGSGSVRGDLVTEALDPKRRALQFVSAGTGAGATAGARLVASGMGATNTALVHGAANTGSSLLNGYIDDGKISRGDALGAVVSGLTGASGANLPDTPKGNLINAGLDGAGGVLESVAQTGRLDATSVAGGLMSMSTSLGAQRMSAPGWGPDTPRPTSDAGGPDVPRPTGDSGDLPRLPPASDPSDPTGPWFAASRSTRRTPPPPIELDGKKYNVSSATQDGFWLEAEGNRSKYIQTEDLFQKHYNKTGPDVDTSVEDRPRRTVKYDKKDWEIDALNGDKDTEEQWFVLRDPKTGAKQNVPTQEASDITFQFKPKGEVYEFGATTHGVIRLNPVERTPARKLSFDEAGPVQVRLKNRELNGLFTVEKNDANQLIATGRDKYDKPMTLEITPDDVQGRYVAQHSPDFERANGNPMFEVDAFDFREAQVKAAADKAKTSHPLQRDPLLGTASADTKARLDKGGESLESMKNFILRDDLEGPLDLFNVMAENQGAATEVFDALKAYKQKNPDEPVRVFMFGRAAMEREANANLKQELADAGIELVVNQRESVRTVNHAKGVVAGNGALLSTAAVYPKTTKKMDATTELDASAAAKYREYMNGVIEGGASDDHQRALLGDLAQEGVFINDPLQRTPMVSRAINDVIDSADNTLSLTINELRDPASAQKLVDQARQGIDVELNVREVDVVSQGILDAAVKDGLPITQRDTSKLEPYPHFNFIGKDLGDPASAEAFVGTAYPWTNHMQMSYHGRSWENGVRLGGDAATDFHQQVNEALDR